ncbi:MAG: hypothetical protein N2316_13745 [Spirochaetes bacterium]|nr:hypothetical protein [Spirochaetota bacterium]
MTSAGTQKPGFLKTKVFSWSHLYDLSILIGDYFIGSVLAKELYGPLIHEGATVSKSVAAFYYCAIPLYLVGILIYLKPLKHCVAIAGVPRPTFTSGDQTAFVFSSCIFGLTAAAIVVEHTNLPNASHDVIGFSVTGIFVLAGGLFYFIHYYAMRIVGTGKGMGKEAYYILLVAGYLLMYPLVVGTFGPISAMQISLDIRLDSSPPTGIFDVFMKSFVRGLMLSFWAWMLIYPIRSIAGAPLGAKGRGWFFFIELSCYYTMKFFIRYYG